MKNTILLLAASLACIFVSCHKSNSGQNYHLTATIDGQTQSFNASLQAIHVGSVGIAIQGKASANDTFPNLDLVLLTPDSPAIGTYDTVSLRSQVIFTLETGDTTRYVSTLTASPIDNHTVLTITAWDATSVQGTFSGDFYLDNTTTGKKTITGEFDVPWKK